MTHAERHTILAIDDDPISLKFITRTLQDNFNCCTAKNGEEGIQLASKKTPDIILLDVNMPGMNGYEVCDRIKHADNIKHTPVVFLSSNSSLKERMQGFESGGDDYLVKPFVKEDLIAKLNVLIKYRAEHKQLQMEMEHARDTAMTALHGSSELGQAIHMVEKFISINSYNELVQLVLNYCHNIGLSCVLIIVDYEGEKHYTYHNYVSPLEKELSSMLRSKKRFVDFGSRTQINYPRVSLLIKNMPIGDMKKYGRIKDFLPSVLSALDLRVNTLNSAKIIAKQNTSLMNSFNVIRSAVSKLAERQRYNLSEGAQIMHAMLQDLSMELPRMGLDMDQENFILDKIDGSIDDAVKVIDSSDNLNHFLELLLNKLHAILDDQVNIVDSVLGISNTIEDNDYDDSDDINVELF